MTGANWATRVAHDTHTHPAWSTTGERARDRLGLRRARCSPAVGQPDEHLSAEKPSKGSVMHLSVDATSPTSVYLYYDEFGLLLYVGITARGVKRQREHNSDKEWWPLVHRQVITHYPTRTEALEVERLTITEHRPPFNVVHNPGHDVLRSNYLAFQQNVCRETSLLAQAEMVDRRLPLFMVALDNNHAEFITDPRFPSLAAALLPLNKAIPIRRLSGSLCGGIHVGGKMHGPSAVLNGLVRGDVPRSAPGFLKFTTPPVPRRQTPYVKASVVLLDAPEAQAA